MYRGFIRMPATRSLTPRHPGGQEVLLRRVQLEILELGAASCGLSLVVEEYIHGVGLKHRRDLLIDLVASCSVGRSDDLSDLGIDRRVAEPGDVVTATAGVVGQQNGTGIGDVEQLAA